MKKLLYIITLSLILFTPAIAQIDVRSTCPQLSVSGPAGVVNPGEAANYTADIGAAGESLNIEYVWSVSSGKIISGQGTRTVAVEQPNSENLVVTVLIKGFPAACVNTADETAAICYCPIPTKLYDFYGDFLIKKISELDEIIVVMKEVPNDQLHVFFAYRKTALQNAIKAHQRKIFKNLTENGLDGRQITFHTVKSGIELVQFWRVPPGAANPICKECGDPHLP